MKTRKKKTKTPRAPREPKYHDLGRKLPMHDFPVSGGWTGPTVKIRLPECPPLSKYERGDKLYLRMVAVVRGKQDGQIELEARRIGVITASPPQDKE